MQAPVLPARRGYAWVVEGFGLFRVAPLAWLALVFGYWIAMTVISFIPFVGVVAASVLVPAFSVGFMTASRAAENRLPLEFSNLGAGFRNHAGAQIALGAVYFAAIAALLAATALSDDGTLARWMSTGERPSAEKLASEEFMRALVVSAVLYVPVMMAFWFAPVLVAWHGLSAAKALFFSFFACLINWRAFLAYGVGAAIALFVLPAGVALVAMMLSAGEARTALLSVMFPFLLMLLPTLFASFYASYRDIFGEREGPPADGSA
ncbi:MAG: hypothetical protein HY017_30925 [Betaproteobacteria bacterium]|nr:hypothetical protein [Betaproteobacteria bacterium]